MFSQPVRLSRGVNRPHSEVVDGALSLINRYGYPEVLTDPTVRLLVVF